MIGIVFAALEHLPALHYSIEFIIILVLWDHGLKPLEGS